MSAGTASNDNQNRLLRVVLSLDRSVLIGSDVRGRIHKFDLDLNLIRSSPVVSYDRPINAVCVSEEFVFTRDRFGAIGKWALDTLAPLDFYDGHHICDARELYPNEVPSPAPSRAIAHLNGRVYTLNGYNQLVVLDAETFAVVDIRESPSKTFLDCMCVGSPSVQALSDVNGVLYLGNLETNEFPMQVPIDTGVVHCVVYDQRHDRFWTTQDGGLGRDRCVKTGVTTIDVRGEGFQTFPLSHEDIEFVALDPTCCFAFVGGFNGKIGVFDNDGPELRLKRVLGPMEFQIIGGAVVSPDQLYVLLQTGDLIRLDGEGQEVARTSFQNRCVWTLEHHPADSAILYAGTDHGIAVLRCTPGRFDTIGIEQLAKHVHGFGIVKDLKVLDDGSYVAISRMGIVFRADTTGDIMWYRQVLGVPRGTAISADHHKCLVSSDAGKVWEFAVADGAVLDTIEVGSPSYACIYADDGRRVATADAGQQVHVYAADSHDLLGTVTGFSHRLKRLTRAENGEIFVTGPNGMFELDLAEYRCRRKFGDYMVSTKENGVLCGGYLYVGGYGYQVASYRYSDGKLIDLQETLPDFTKAFAVCADGSAPILLVGGRGGFMIAYRLRNGIPNKIREFYVR